MMRAMRFCLLAKVFFFVSLSALAQETPPKVPAADDTPSKKPPLEQTIYIPYDKLRATFEKEGRGVFIPYERFQELWKAAREHSGKLPDVKPPVAAVITEADNEATVGKETMQVKARLKIDVLQRGWVEVPLRLNDAGIISATLVGADGKEEPARLAIAADGGYQLLIENKTDAPRAIELRLEYAKEFRKTPGRNEVSFAAPQAPVNRWRVRIPETGVKVNIEPLIAATEPPAKAADGKPDDKPLTETVLLAFVGTAPSVKIDWTAEAEGASGLAALANVESQQEVQVEEGALHTRARLTYTISRAELSQLTLEVPADQKVVNIAGANVRQWSVEAADKTQKLTVQLFEPARQTETISIELEQFGDRPDAAKADDGKPAEASSRRTVNVPMIKALDVSRQQGIVVVDVADDLQVEAGKHDGLVQMDASELPQSLSQRSHALAYRYAALPFALTLEAIKIKPRLIADEFVLAVLEPEQLTLDLHVVFTVERAGVFEFALDVPAGFEVRDVRGEAVSGAEAVQVDSHHLEGDDKTRLIVDVSHKALGRVALVVQLHKRLDDVNLLGPTGKSVDVTLPVPRVAPESLERTVGRLVVYSPESLRVNPGKQSGLRSVSLAEALSGGAAPPAERVAAARPVLSFLYAKTPVELTLTVERRKPYISVGQLLVTRVDPGVVKYQATFSYDIRYSGVKSLRIDLPEDLASQIHNNTSAITEKIIEPPPADLDKGYVAWRLSGESELLGTVAVQLSWEQRLENLEVGKSIELDSPRLRPRDVDRAWGQVVLVKAETIDLVPSKEPTGARSIDPQHDLMPGANVPDAALAFEFHNDWALRVKATRYQLESVKHTSIERGVVRVVITRGDQLAVQALYRMRSARQRLALELPSGVAFDTEPLRINGQATPLERGAKGEFFVPLVGRGNNEPFLLELRYTLPETDAHIELPKFSDEPAVQRVFVSAFLPQELSLLGSQGPWTDEQDWHYVSPFRRVPAPHYTDAGLVNWVREGVSISGNPADTFPVDGQPYVYSTLRPEPGEAGSLRLVTINGKWLNALIFVGLVGLGIALVRRPIADRATALAAVVIALLLIGVFLPTFSTQLMYGGLWLAVVLTAIVWLVVFVRDRSRQRRAMAAVPAESPSAPPGSPPDSPTVSGPTSQEGETHV